MKKLVFLLLAVMLLAACGQDKENDQGAVYVNITAEEAKQIMDSEEGYIILDVRRPDEFAAGHIPGAVNLPNEIIGAAESAEDEEIKNILPDQEQLILVYCRSGNRSKQASQKLADLGYVHIVEFGGIQDWPGEIEY